MSTFLRYAVETKLAGEADKLKEFVIGADVFKLGDSFDPQTDNVVRVSANRLRSKLAEYYQQSGERDPVVIGLPKGRYVPFFTSSQAPAQNAFHELAPSALLRTSVGRQNEFDRIRASFASASNGTGLMVAISGDSGMGKTTIVEDFLSEIETSTTAAWIVRGRCSERLAETNAFAPISECMDDLTRGMAGIEAAQLMKENAPIWLTQIAPASQVSTAIAASEPSPERMRREFARFFEALSIVRPVILFLDDLHWTDASTCDLLAYLGSRIKDFRILIITTYRPSKLSGPHPFLSLQGKQDR